MVAFYKVLLCVISILFLVSCNHCTLKSLKSRGMIQASTRIPKKTNPKQKTLYRYVYYIINENGHDQLIEITDRGRSEIHTYTP